MKKVTSIVLNPYINDSRVIKETQSLRKAGYEVSVVALHDDREGLAEYEVMDGVAVHRIKLVSKSWSKLPPIQVLKYLEFCARAICEIKADIVHCNDLNALPVGYILKSILRCKKIVYDAHELESERNEQGSLAKHLARFLEGVLIKNVDAVITVSDGIADWYKHAYGIKRPNVIMNVPEWKDIQKHNLFAEENAELAWKKIFLYQGGLSAGRGIEYMLEAFSKRRDNKAVLMFMGYGSLAEKIKEAAQVYDNIFYHEAVTPQELWRYTASADYGLVCTENTCLSHYYSLPNKLFEYAMAGIPMILTNLHEFIFLNNQYKFGVVLENSSAREINDKIDYLLDIDANKYGELSSNAKKMAKDLAWEQQGDRLQKIYSDLQ